MKQSPTAGVHTFCDRQKPLPDGAAQYYVAGHLPVKLPDYNSRLRVLVATYVTFSPNGTELLVNMGGEQVYLFDLTYKQRPYTFLLPRKCHPVGKFCPWGTFAEVGGILSTVTCGEASDLCPCTGKGADASVTL